MNQRNCDAKRVWVHQVLPSLCKPMRNFGNMKFSNQHSSLGFPSVWALGWIATSCFALASPAWSQVLNEDFRPLQSPSALSEGGVENQLGTFDQTKAPDEKKEELSDEAKQKLLTEITRALLLEFDARQQRIDTARLRLDAVEAKLKLSRNRMGQIAQSRLEDRLAELKKGRSTTPSVPGLKSPEAVLDRFAECLESKDIEGLVALLSDDARDELAGCLLLTTAGISFVGQFAESIPDSMSPAELAVMRSAGKLIESATLVDPPEKAKQAYKELMQLYVASMFRQPRPLNFPSMKDPLKTAAGVLRDPRQFIVDSSSAIQDVTGTGFISNSENLEGSLKWNIEVDGDEAVANLESAEAPQVLSNQIKLQRVDGRWKISRLIREEMLSALEFGALEVGSPVGSLSESPSETPTTSPSTANPLTAKPPAQSTPLTAIPSSNPATLNPTSPSAVLPSNPELGSPTLGSPALSSPTLGSPVLNRSELEPLSSPATTRPNRSGGDFGRDLKPNDRPTSSTPSLGQDLTEFPPVSLPEPVYSGRPIDYWLNTYWLAVTSDQPYGNALNAIKTLRSQPSSDPLVERFLADTYKKIANELDTRYLGKVSDCIVTIAGPRHQQQAVDYLFEIAEKNPRTEPVDDVPYDFADKYFLRGAVGELSKWDEPLAKRLAAVLAHGSSRQRELALTMFLMFRDGGNFLDSQKEIESWFDQHRDFFKPSLLTASRDGTPYVRSLALMLLGSIAPKSDEFKTRLTEIVESDPSTSLRTLAMMNVVAIQPDDPFVHRTLLSWAKSGERDLVSSAIDNMYPNEERGVQAIDELMELLEDKDWGRGLVLEGAYPGSTRKTARQRAISALAYFGEKASRAVPTLQADLESDDRVTVELAGEAIDQIVGFSESLPVEPLAGTWQLVGVTNVGKERSLLDVSDLSPVIKIAGTKIMSGDRVIARISKARGGRRPEQVRLLIDPKDKKVRASGIFHLNLNSLTLALQSVSSLDEQAPQPKLGAAGGDMEDDKRHQQVYKFQWVAEGS
ncbi:MAG: hypothetical protein AAGG48_06340 [Planctomycetota bacterium]